MVLLFPAPGISSPCPRGVRSSHLAGGHRGLRCWAPPRPPPAAQPSAPSEPQQPPCCYASRILFTDVWQFCKLVLLPSCLHHSSFLVTGFQVRCLGANVSCTTTTTPAPHVLRSTLIHLAALRSDTQLALKTKIKSQTWLPALAGMQCLPFVKCDHSQILNSCPHGTIENPHLKVPAPAASPPSGWLKCRAAASVSWRRQRVHCSPGVSVVNWPVMFGAVLLGVHRVGTCGLAPVGTQLSLMSEYRFSPWY